VNILEAFLEGVWNVVWKGDGTIGHWPNENYDMSLIRDKELGILVAITNDEGEDVKKYRVRLEEVK